MIEAVEAIRSGVLSYEGELADRGEWRHSLLYAEAEVRAEGKKLRGIAAPFGKRADLGVFIEEIKPGAFRKTLQERDDQKALWQHDAGIVLASRDGGGLKLREESAGLAFEIDPKASSQAVRDLYLSQIENGHVNKMSFGFRTIKDQWGTEDGKTLRTLMEVELFEISPVTFPAYRQTSVGLRGAVEQAMELRGRGLTAEQILSKLRGCEESRSTDFDLLRRKLDLAEAEFPG